MSWLTQKTPILEAHGLTPGERAKQESGLLEAPNLASWCAWRSPAGARLEERRLGRLSDPDAAPTQGVWAGSASAANAGESRRPQRAGATWGDAQPRSGPRARGPGPRTHTVRLLGEARSPQSSAPAQATPGNAYIRETYGGVRRRRHEVEGKMAAAAVAWC
jgi:hypothetical protein